MTCGPSHLRSWQGDSSTNRMYGSTPRDALNAEIMQIEISTFTGDSKRKALTQVQFKVLKKHFSLFIFH